MHHSDRSPNRQPCHLHGPPEENALTRVPAGHPHPREQALIRRLLDLRITRQEGDPVPLSEYVHPPRHKM